LDKQEPDLGQGFQPAECLHFEYRYPVLPEGLLPRFISTHAPSMDSPDVCTVVLAF
jgi:internalin A